MSNGSQAATAVACAPRVFEPDSSLTPHSTGASAVSSPSILLVGRNGSWATSVLKSLAKYGCEMSFVTPKAATSKYVRNGAYDLILLDSTVAAEQRRQLVAELVGSHSSVFYTFPVENGCWWLPTLRRGQGCHGAPAFRRSEFQLELERILQDQRETQPSVMQFKPRA
jgi:hypothetical protein